jgi:hypothetical protein
VKRCKCGNPITEKSLSKCKPCYLKEEDDPAKRNIVMGGIFHPHVTRNKKEPKLTKEGK